MTKQEIENKIEELTKKRFYLAMKDRWFDKDFFEDDKLYYEITKLEKMLKEGK